MPSYYKGIPNNTHPNAFKDPCLRMNMFWAISLALSSVFLGYDAVLFGSLQALPSFFEAFPRLASDSNLLGIVGAVYSFAGIYTLFIVSWFADRFGRKLPCILGLSLLLVGPIAMAFAPNLGVLIFGRWLLGTGGITTLNMAATLLAEIAHPRFRAIFSSLMMCGFYVGAIVCSATVLGAELHLSDRSWAWRVPTMVQMIVPGLLLGPYLMMPESPRWLIARGRHQEAKNILAKTHANGDLDDALVAFEMTEVVEAITAEKQALGIKALITSKANRWRLIILIALGFGTQFTGSSVISYYFVPVLESVGIKSSLHQLEINLGLSIFNLFFSVGAALLVERLGRRFLFLGAMSTIIITFIVVTACSAAFLKDPSSALGGVVVAFLFFFNAGYDIAFTSLTFTYPTEILPYTLRTAGLAVQNFVGCVGLFFGLWVNPVALKNIGYKYYIVFLCCDAVLITVIYFYFPETKGLTLEEVASIFEGKDKVAGAINPDVARVAFQEDDKAAPEDDKGALEMTHLEQV